jgi:hypothetical protein
MKRSKLSGTNEFIFGTGGSNTVSQFFFDSSERLRYGEFTGEPFVTAASFRDPSAWYHFVFVFDTTNATSADRYILYVNGTRATTSTYTAPTQNTDGAWNRNVGHAIGGTADGGSNAPLPSFNGYLADIHFIDGQALDPTSFGEFSATTGVWMPKQYTGTYGTNGFKLDFADNSSNTATTLGKDTSGNGNNWTPNNLSVTAGAGNDSLVDVPTNGSEVDTGSGGQVRGNYPTWNPLKRFNVNVALANGNLDTSVSQTASTEAAVATFALPTTGKWYWEITLQTYTNASADVSIGVGTLANATQNTASNLVSGGGYYRGNGTITNLSNSAQTSGGTWSQGDIIGIAVDVGAGTAQFYKNNVAQGATPSFSFTAGTELVPYIANDNSANAKGTNANFGQRPFAYTAPSGFKALCTANLPAPLVTKPSSVFDVKLYMGNGGTQTISALGFSPDLVWLKARNNNFVNGLFDTVRGPSRFLVSNSTVAELVNEVDGYLSAFTSDGFTLSPGTSSSNTFNSNAGTQVAWTWDAGSSTVTNTQGSITSSVRANASAGFSIVTYTGGGVDGSVGHGLGVAPVIYFVKNRSASSNWAVAYTIVDGSLDFMYLNLTNAAGNATQSVPTSTVINLQQSAGETTNGNNYVIYCFAPVASYSAFGRYTGNGSTDGPFVYTGFRPRFILVKRTDGVIQWTILDTARSPANVADQRLFPNLSQAETVNGDGNTDLLSNGFKPRNVDSAFNANGGTYIYAAFAESPFQYARAR